MRLLRYALALAVLGLPIAPTSALAQQTESRLVGTIADSSQSLLPGVTVTVTSKDTGAQRVAVSEADGRFTVTNLPRGTYVVSATLEGFRTVEQTVTLGVGEVKSVDLSLSVAAMAETVTVTADTRRARCVLGQDRRQCDARRSRQPAGERPQLRQPDDAVARRDQ